MQQLCAAYDSDPEDTPIQPNAATSIVLPNPDPSCNGLSINSITPDVPDPTVSSFLLSLVF